MSCMEKDITAKLFFIDLYREVANDIVILWLAAKIIIFILDLQDEADVFPVVLESYRVGNVFENHFYCIIKTIKKTGAVFVVERLIVHSLTLLSFFIAL